MVLTLTDLAVTERTFQQEVLESSQLVLVNFGAPWCGLCHLISPIVRSCHAQWGEEVKLVEINADENLRLANTYRLKSLPTLLLFAEGQVVQRIDHFQGRDNFRKSLESILRTQCSRSVRLLESSEC
ncbi:MAG: thioredoxin [Coleofasciculaceae cyanobacterium SM2_1_6]|nr:thioredoxin [Coleofasciculaceae cyanobacterium SM2_1_6]